MTVANRAARDRRFYHRAEVHLSGETVLLGNALAGVDRFTTATLDLSLGGARIHVPEELPLGQLLSLHLFLPDGTDHYCRARVLRSAAVTEGEEEAGTWAAVQFIEV
jgi:c-di-GMP-binding flagellar brake protein YcgR